MFIVLIRKLAQLATNLPPTCKGDVSFKRKTFLKIEVTPLPTVKKKKKTLIAINLI